MNDTLHYSRVFGRVQDGTSAAPPVSNRGCERANYVWMGLDKLCLSIPGLSVVPLTLYLLKLYDKFLRAAGVSYYQGSVDLATLLRLGSDKDGIGLDGLLPSGHAASEYQFQKGGAHGGYCGKLLLGDTALFLSTNDSRPAYFEIGYKTLLSRDVDRAFLGEFLGDVGIILGDEKIRVKRLDLALDMRHVLSNIGLDEWDKNWHGRSSLDGTKRGTIYIGKRASTMALCVYDKVAQATQEGDIDELYQLWGSECEAVTRYEWRIRPFDRGCEGLQFLEDVTPEAIRQLVQSCREWGRLTVPSRGDTDKRRWSTHPQWAEVDAVLAGLAAGRSSLSTAKKEVRPVLECSDHRYQLGVNSLARMMGHVGCKMGLDVPASLYEVISAGALFLPGDFLRDVESKAAEFWAAEFGSVSMPEEAAPVLIELAQEFIDLGRPVLGSDDMFGDGPLSEVTRRCPVCRQEMSGRFRICPECARVLGGTVGGSVSDAVASSRAKRGIVSEKRMGGDAAPALSGMAAKSQAAVGGLLSGLAELNLAEVRAASPGAAAQLQEALELLQEVNYELTKAHKDNGKKPSQGG